MGTTKNPSLFTEDERELFDDLLTEYIDKYNMMEMPKDIGSDGEEYHWFDSTAGRIQYLVQRLRNIGIDIESNRNISLDNIYDDIKQNFIPRVERYGYHIFHCDKEVFHTRNAISITIMKK